MSIVVAVKKAGRTVIASDTLSSFGRTKVSVKYLKQPGKIHKAGDSYIGIVGATAHDNVLEHIIEREGKNLRLDNAEVIFDTYLNLHTTLKEKYFLNPNERDDDEYESSRIDALVANANGIFGMYSLREVYEFERFWAIGSGEDYALGSMYAVYDLYEEPEKIAEVGVKAACEFDDGCELPMNIYSVELNKGRDFE
jgi:ATP-dependent HslUV protease, peptidase subunit HslV